MATQVGDTRIVDPLDVNSAIGQSSLLLGSSTDFLSTIMSKMTASLSGAPPNANSPTQTPTPSDTVAQQQKNKNAMTFKPPSDFMSQAEGESAFNQPDFGTEAALKKSGDIANSMMSGEIPEDVKSQIEQQSAERALSSGTGLDGAGKNLVARDLGLTSLDLKQKGAQLAQTNAQIQNSIVAQKAQMAQWKQSYAQQRDAMKLDQITTSLKASELVVQSMKFTTNLATQLIARSDAESNTKIAEWIDVLIGNSDTGEDGFFTEAQRQALQLVGLKKKSKK